MKAWQLPCATKLQARQVSREVGQQAAELSCKQQNLT
jgi:hypothetical protein